MHFETFGTHSCSSQSSLCVSLSRSLSLFDIALAGQRSAQSDQDYWVRWREQAQVFLEVSPQGVSHRPCQTVCG